MLVKAQNSDSALGLFWTSNHDDSVIKIIEGELAMGFWDELGEAALLGLAAAGSMVKILEWEQLPDHDEMGTAIARYVRYASKSEIQMVDKGFCHRLVQIRALREMSKLLTIHEIFCIEVFKRFGENESW